MNSSPQTGSESGVPRPIPGPAVRSAAGLARSEIQTWARTALPPVAGPILIVLLAGWLCRRFLVGGALPAGTDMFDVLARAKQNAHWNVLLSPWSPSGLGLSRQVSLDNLLGLLVLLTGRPVRTVELLMTALVVGSGLSTYWVVKRWYANRVAATLAALLYMTSQASLGRVASGWLHYEALIAVTPLLLCLWVELLDRFSATKALAFSVLAAGLIFARQDMVLWLIPAFAVYVPISLVCGSPGSRPIHQLAKTVTVATATVAGLSLYLILPLAGGIHAPWLSTGEVFQAIRFNLVDRSLDAYQSVLGLGRDLGYLPFNGQEWWNFHPWFGLPVYYALQTTIVIAAIAAVAVKRDRRTIYLLACAVVAAFLGKGIRGPFGQPYEWAVEHVPVFGNLRGPNRWLIVQAFAYAALASITVHWLYTRLLARGEPRGLLSPRGVRLGAIAVGAAFFLPVAPTLISGFRTWEPPPASVALMETIARDPTQSPVVSVPYDQSMQYVNASGYSGWEHDLGVESPLYTGHPALSTNSWDRRGSDFVDFTASLLRQRNPAFTSLLGSVGVKYALRFNNVAESARNGMHASQQEQQQDLATLPGLTPLRTTSAGRLYRLNAAAPFLSFRTNIAVVLGGRAGLAALANLPGIHLRNWAAFTADDVVSGPGSLSQLISMMRASDLILVSGATLGSISVLASRPVVRIAGITSDPSLDRRNGLLLTDESARQGSLADPAIPPPGLVSASGTRFRLSKPRRLELWARVLAAPDAGTIRFRVDGRTVRSLVQLSPGSDAFRWIRIATLNMSAGGHSVAVSGGPSSYGSTFEVDEARLIDPATRLGSLRRLRREITLDSAKVAYSVDLSEGPYRGDAAVPLGSPGEAFWHVQDTVGIAGRKAIASVGSTLLLTLAGRRRFYTFAYHAFARPQSWASRTYVVLHFLGAGDGARYSVLADFNKRHTNFASFSVIDTHRGWQTVALPILKSVGDWHHVVSIRVASQSKSGRAAIGLGPVALLFPTSLIKDVDLATSSGAVPRVAGWGARKVRLTRASSEDGIAVHARIPSRLVSRPLWLVIGPRRRVVEAPLVPVRVKGGKTARYTYSFNASRRGVLVFDQTYDARWVATDGARNAQPTGPVMSLVDGFSFKPGRHAGSVAYKGRTLVRLGALLSALGPVLALTLLLVFFVVRRKRPDGDAAPESLPEPPAVGLTVSEIGRSVVLAGAVLALAPWSLGASALIALVGSLTRAAEWRRPSIVACVLILACPVWIALSRPDIADRTSVVATLTLLVAVVRLMRATREAART